MKQKFRILLKIFFKCKGVPGIQLKYTTITLILYIYCLGGGEVQKKNYTKTLNFTCWMYNKQRAKKKTDRIEYSDR